jgi:hypothetical protein
LKDVLANKVPYEQERVKKFRKEHGNVKIGEITVDMVCKTEIFPVMNHSKLCYK